MANKQTNNFLVNKSDVASIANTGKITIDANNKDLSNKVLLNVRNQEQAQMTSPSENINVLAVRDLKSQKLYDSAVKVQKLLELEELGKETKNYEIAEIPIESYLEKKFSKYRKDFETVIQSRGNENLGLVALYIKMASEQNDQVSLGIMTEFIRKDPNYKFAFRADGTLDLEKLYELALMPEQDVKEGYDNAEEIEKTTGEVDVSKMTSAQISDMADKQIEEVIQQGQDAVDSAEFDDAEFESQEENNSNDVVNDSAQRKATQIFAKVALAGSMAIRSIRNMRIREQAQSKLQVSLEKGEKLATENLQRKGQTKKQKSKAKNSKSQAVMAKAVGENSIESLFERMSNSKSEEERPELQKQREDTLRVEREKIAKQKEIERIKAKYDSGKKLNKREAEIFIQDRNERAQQAEAKMREQSSINQYNVDKSVIAATNNVALEMKRRAEEQRRKDVEEKQVADKDDGR